jgi:hypothetical protein
MTRMNLLTEWAAALTAGKFLTPKHDPNNPNPYAMDRSVLTHEMSASLESLFATNDFDIAHYSNSRFPMTPDYYVITPHSSSAFDTVAQFVPSGSIVPTGSCDRLVVVSGSKAGPHVHGELQSTINAASGSGVLKLLGNL